MEYLISLSALPALLFCRYSHGRPAFHLLFPPLFHSTALIRSNRSSYRSYRRSIYINRCLYTFLNVLSLLHLTVRIGITTTGIAAIILLPNICYVHRSPFTVLVISDSPSLMYLLAYLDFFCVDSTRNVPALGFAVFYHY